MPMPPNQVNTTPGTLSDLLLPGNPFLGTLPRKYWRKLKKAFGYPVNYLPLAAAASQSVQPITIDSDSDFIAMICMLEATDATNLIELSFTPALINVQSSLNNMFMFQQDVHVKTFATLGGAQPLYFPMPFIFPAGTTLNTRLTNLDTVNARNYRLTYYGFKVFKVDTD